MIVDSHAHLGFDQVFDEEFTEAELLAAQRDHGIDRTIVQPALAHDLTVARACHDAIAALAEEYPGQFAGMANPSPHLEPADYRREMRRCVRELGFVGVKLNPLGHAVNPLGRAGREVFTTAADLGVPVMVHTGTGVPWSNPAMLGPLARGFPATPVILAHAGGGIHAAEASILASEHDNVFLEVSWSAGFMVRRWVRTFGAERVMFGSDHADNVTTELAKLRSLDLDQADLAMVLGGTAAKVYDLAEGRG